jgi:hypothetical protein
MERAYDPVTDRVYNVKRKNQAPERTYTESEVRDLMYRNQMLEMRAHELHLQQRQTESIESIQSMGTCYMLWTIIKEWTK